MIPELQERGILRNIIHNLYVALKKRNDNVVRYKALIDAKVPKKGNSYRKENVNFHFLFSRLSM